MKSPRNIAVRFLVPAVLLVPSIALAQPPEDVLEVPEIVASDYIGDETGFVPAPLALPDFVTEVRSQTGELAPAYREETRCDGGGCETVIVLASSGEVVFLSGRWVGGYLATGRGEQVWHVEREDTSWPQE